MFCTHLILSISRANMLERLPKTPPLPSPLYWPNWWESEQQVHLFPSHAEIIDTLYHRGNHSNVDLLGNRTMGLKLRYDGIYPKDGLNCLQRICGCGSNGLCNGTDEKDLCWGYLQKDTKIEFTGRQSCPVFSRSFRTALSNMWLIISFAHQIHFYYCWPTGQIGWHGTQTNT